MGKIVYDMSMSLDGYVTALGQTAEEPLGAGGERLHEWAFPGTDARSAELMEQNGRALGAMITGRRTYDESLPWWGEEGPSGAQRLPLFILTHRTDPPPASDVYTFVTDGVDAVVARARAVAGDANIAVSGVATGRQLIQAGYVDELWIHVVPILFGGGMRLFDQLSGDHVELELVEGVPTPLATHLRYSVRKAA